MFAFLLLLATYYLKSEASGLIREYYPILCIIEECGIINHAHEFGDVWLPESYSMHFFLLNLSRVVQHSIITVVLYLYIYTDRKSFIPFLINTMIVVLYSSSSLVIFFTDNLDAQRIIVGYKEIFGSLVLLSLFNYGNNFYDRLYNRRVFNTNKYISRLYSVIVFRKFEKKAEKESGIV